ncbi:hypothetical protein HC928_10385 [bacterium]|nr:hypothetical protein [bacterium]
MGMYLLGAAKPAVESQLGLFGDEAPIAAGTQGFLPEVPRYGLSWENWRSQTDKTYGIFVSDGSRAYLQSGNTGPSARMPQGTPGMNGVLKSHVEAHVGAITRLEPGIQSGTLYINRLPCTAPSGGCSENIPKYLREGFQLTVIGPDGYRQDFVGSPD